MTISRLVLTEQQQATIDQWRTDNGISLSDFPVMEGTNVVIDDHLQIGGAWVLVVVGGTGDTEACQIYVPDWDYLAPVNFLDDVTDRAGPQGQTMPVLDAAQLEARVAAKAAKNPKSAAKAERKEARAERRSLHELLDAQVDPKVRKSLHAQLVAHGLLGKDDD